MLLDSYAIMELFRGTKKGEKVRDLLEEEKEVYISTLTIYEVGAALQRELGKKKAHEYVNSIKTHYQVVEVSEEVALEAVELRGRFKLPAMDCLIYASARQKGARIVSGCKHFREIKDEKDVVIV